MRLRDFRPLYFHDLDIRVGAVRLHRLALNRHLPEKDWVKTHRHRFAQFLLYLTGRGLQKIGEETHAARPGGLFLLPGGIDHSFVEAATGRRPLCLALDMTLPAESEVFITVLTRSEINRIRHSLAALTRWQADDVAVEPREAAAVLQMLDVLLRATGHLRRDDPHPTAILRRVREALEECGGESLAQIARRIGYHPDHLNRLLKQTAGLSMSQLRDEIRLKRAKTLLRHARRIGDAAWEAGFPDPNYFSRWFRAQTGLTPAAWRKRTAR